MYFKLLKEWCDALIKLQITEISRKEVYGGIMCPSCARIHGRSGDAVYPMMFMADKTGEEKYLECARKLFLWSENMAKEDGSYYNDTNSDWRGITVFAAIQLGEALHYHGHLLDEGTKELWLNRFKISLEYLYHNIEKIGGNINYPVTCSAAMALGAVILGRKDYEEKARKLARGATHYFTEDLLLFGEGKPNDGITSKGCFAVDLGYNVEESLPGLVTYALLLKDEAVLEAAIKSMEKHTLFMLPDGAWDNSWGTRNNKWTYWGSRTSDGCHAGYGLLADKNPLFAEVVYRNTLLLKACTKDGLLYGGPMYVEALEPPCVHHTICHAKALAVMLEHEINPEGGCILPRDHEEQNLTYFPSVHVGLIAKGGFRGTISDYDFEYSVEGHGTGGVITMLWHREAGPLLAGTMTKYSLVEPNNMQLPKVTADICLTPRIESKAEGICYRSINDKSAQVDYVQGEKVIVTATGILRDGYQNGEDTYLLQYEFSEKELIIKGMTSSKHARFIMPVISPIGEETKEEDFSCRIIKKNCIVYINGQTKKDNVHLGTAETVKSSTDLINHMNFLAPVYEKGTVKRIFNPVGGFQGIPYCLNLTAGEEFRISIAVISKEA